MAPAKNLQPRSDESPEGRRIQHDIAALTMHLNWHGPMVTDVIMGLLPADMHASPCRLLDLGCGNGELARRFLERSPLWRAVCLNVLDLHLTLARERLVSFGDRASFLAQAVEDLTPSAELGRFTHITACALLHFIDDADLDRVVATAHDLLLPGGLFIATQYISHPVAFTGIYQHGAAAFRARDQPQGDVKATVDALQERRRDLIAQGAIIGHHSSNVFHTPERLMLACQRAGFAAIDMPWRLYGMVMVAGLRG
jgi:SAM-dependent methyltransferase